MSVNLKRIIAGLLHRESISVDHIPELLDTIELLQIETIPRSDLKKARDAKIDYNVDEENRYKTYSRIRIELLKYLVDNCSGMTIRCKELIALMGFEHLAYAPRREIVSTGFNFIGKGSKRPELVPNFRPIPQEKATAEMTDYSPPLCLFSSSPSRNRRGNPVTVPVMTIPDAWHGVDTLFRREEEQFQWFLVGLWTTIPSLGKLAPYSTIKIPVYDPVKKERNALLDFLRAYNRERTEFPLTGLEFVRKEGDKVVAIVENDETPLSQIINHYEDPARRDPTPLGVDTFPSNFAVPDAQPYGSEIIRRTAKAMMASNGDIVESHSMGLQSFAIVLSCMGTISEEKIAKIANSGGPRLDRIMVRTYWDRIKHMIVGKNGPRMAATLVKQMSKVLEEAVPLVRNQLGYTKYAGESSYIIIANTMLSCPDFPWQLFGDTLAGRAAMVCSVIDGQRKFYDVPKVNTVLSIKKEGYNEAMLCSFNKRFVNAMTLQLTHFNTELIKCFENPYRRFSGTPGTASQLKDLIYLCKRLQKTILKNRSIINYGVELSSQFSIPLDLMIENYRKYQKNVMVAARKTGVDGLDRLAQVAAGLTTTSPEEYILAYQAAHVEEEDKADLKGAKGDGGKWDKGGLLKTKMAKIKI